MHDVFTHLREATRSPNRSINFSAGEAVIHASALRFTDYHFYLSLSLRNITISRLQSILCTVETLVFYSPVISRFFPHGFNPVLIYSVEQELSTKPSGIIVQVIISPWWCRGSAKARTNKLSTDEMSMWPSQWIAIYSQSMSRVTA